MVRRRNDKGVKGEAAARKALGAYIKLMRAADSVTALVHGPLRWEGLTVSQFGVLEALLHLGPLTQVELGRKILKSGGNMTMVIDNLERRQLVRRERQAGDRRSRLIHLTGRGRGVIEAAFPPHAGRIAGAMGALTSGEQEELGRLCRKLGRAAARKKGSKDENSTV